MENQAFDWQEYVLTDYPFTAFAPKAMVLDLGCGKGKQMEELGVRGCSAIGLEPDWTCLLRCREKTLPVLQGVAEKLPFADSTFDGVICKGVVPYTEVRLAFHEIGRVLKPGGMCRAAYLGAGYYLRYLLAGPSWKLRAYGLRTIVNTWWQAVTRAQLPGFLGDTVYQTRHELNRHYQEHGLRLLQDSPSPRFLGLPVFIYHLFKKCQ